MPESGEVSTVRKAQVIALHEAGSSVLAISLKLHISRSSCSGHY